jgi:hypothetical protein
MEKPGISQGKINTGRIDMGVAIKEASAIREEAFCSSKTVRIRPVYRVCDPMEDMDRILPPRP